MTLCNGCGVGDSRPKHSICYDFRAGDIRDYHPEHCPGDAENPGPFCMFCPKEAA